MVKRKKGKKRKKGPAKKSSAEKAASKKKKNPKAWIDEKLRVKSFREEAEEKAYRTLYDLLEAECEEIRVQAALGILENAASPANAAGAVAEVVSTRY